MFQDCIEFQQHFVIPEADHTKSDRFQIFDPHIITNLLLDVLAAIQLDRESGFNADEIRNVWTERQLSPELPTSQLTSAQGTPQYALGIGGTLVKSTGKRGVDPLVHAWLLPGPALTLPSPASGRGSKHRSAEHPASPP